MMFSFTQVSSLNESQNSWFYTKFSVVFQYQLTESLSYYRYLLIAMVLTNFCPCPLKLCPNFLILQKI